MRAFDLALELSPKAASLALKCADALVTAHDYGRAVDYYARAVRNDPSKVCVSVCFSCLCVYICEKEVFVLCPVNRVWCGPFTKLCKAYADATTHAHTRTPAHRSRRSTRLRRCT